MKSKKGAPVKNKKIAEFAELLLYLPSINDPNSKNPYKFNKYNNEDCRIIHDYLVFWGLIENKKKDNQINSEKVNDPYSTPHNYIRSLINNLRKQRESKSVK